MASRTDKSLISEWWWTVDKVLLTSILLLMLAGIILSFAASPPQAARMELSDDFYFVKRHGIFLIGSLIAFLGTSLMPPNIARRLCLLVFVGALMAMIAVLFVGNEVKGATRWIVISGFSLQPSEFIKPAFIVIAAWLFAENTKRKDVPGNILSIMLLIIVTVLLVAQPDFGQTALVLAVWSIMFFMAGMPWFWIICLGVLGIGGAAAAYATVSHVALRVNRFLFPDSGENYQVERAVESFIQGGWFGRGPGEGTIKRSLPDSHTDFVFAVAGEEFGILICLFLVTLFGLVVFRGFIRAVEEEDAFLRLSIVGLVSLFGLQAAINIAVNLSLVPAKGMTLPFLSYGGSSLLSLGFAMGLVLSMTRKRATGRRRAFPSDVGAQTA